VDACVCCITSCSKPAEEKKNEKIKRMIRFSNRIMETPHFYGDSKYPIGDSAASLYNWMAVIREMCELATALPSTGGGRGVRERSCSEAIHMAIKRPGVAQGCRLTAVVVISISRPDPFGRR